ncbi:hypothetical protein AB1N83_007305 [Pleurotus pulmonarius]
MCRRSWRFGQLANLIFAPALFAKVERQGRLPHAPTITGRLQRMFMISTRRGEDGRLRGTIQIRKVASSECRCTFLMVLGDPRASICDWNVDEGALVLPYYGRHCYQDRSRDEHSPPHADGTYALSTIAQHLPAHVRGVSGSSGSSGLSAANEKVKIDRK